MRKCNYTQLWYSKCVLTSYSLKWKPADENSVDFKLTLVFPHLVDNDSDEDDDQQVEDDEPRLDYSAMPEFRLSVFEGNRQYTDWGAMYMTEEEWEDMKALNIPLDDTIVECAMDEQKRWRFKRFRDDKKDANHISTVKSVIDSIKDAVGKEDLERAAPEIRSAWKARIAAQQNKPNPSQ